MPASEAARRLRLKTGPVPPGIGSSLRYHWKAMGLAPVASTRKDTACPGASDLGGESGWLRMFTGSSTVTRATVLVTRAVFEVTTTM